MAIPVLGLPLPQQVLRAVPPVSQMVFLPWLAVRAARPVKVLRPQLGAREQHQGLMVAQVGMSQPAPMLLLAEIPLLPQVVWF